MTNDWERRGDGHRYTERCGNNRNSKVGERLRDIFRIEPNAPVPQELAMLLRRLDDRN
ncbi:hypothetical protein [Glacieibacterium sp.]|uniref:hypothetical protein n=1 Tax=Glacieibacterium sp. TaxID=2860237 RepID=UPI003AFFA698